jgi:branched-subunit amino acid ABC-type transport system permease component
VLNWPNFLSQCFNGLVTGALLALISSGLTIIYGTLGVLNLAHGAMFMLGGYAGWVAYTYTGSFIVAVIAGSLFVMIVGVPSSSASSYANFIRGRLRTRSSSPSALASSSLRRCAISSAVFPNPCRRHRR